MAATFNGRLSMAWRKAGLGTKERPGELFKTFTQKDFDQLKADYVAKYGYTIRIPQIDEVIHWKPNALKTEQELKDEKKANLIRILESPMPEWQQYYSSVMTWIDNIQDTSSVLIPLMNLAFRAAPKAMGKLLGILGWLTLGYDILNLMNAYGQAPITLMGGKRAVCKWTKFNPFTKQSQWNRIDRIKHWRPNLADFIQAAQVSDQFLGVGLSLGGIMGTIMSLPSAAYRYITGNKVQFSIEQVEIDNLSRLGGRALQTASYISSQGQVFDELTHFYTYVTAALGAMACSGNFKESDFASRVEDPMNIAMPADRPTDPLTIAVIREAGLDPEAGIGWPFNGEKEIGLGDLLDATHEPIRTNFFDFAMRHSKDWYGWIAAWAMDYVAPHTIGAIDPNSEYVADDTPIMKVFWKMIKAPLLPVGTPTEQQQKDFYRWVNDYKEAYGKGTGNPRNRAKIDFPGDPGHTLTPARGTHNRDPVVASRMDRRRDITINATTNARSPRS